MAKQRESLGRIPPHSLEAETAVLGAILLSNDALNRALEILRPADFYDARHRLIFQAMIDLTDEMSPVDRVTLAQRLKAKDQLEKIGGGVYLAGLDLAEPTAAHISHYASIVKDYSLARELIDRASKIVAQGYEPGSDIDSLLDAAEQSIFEVAEHKIKPSFYELREVVNDSFKRLEELADRKEPITGVASGFIDLDRLTAGFQDSDLVIIAGRPSMGKTALALNVALHAASRSSVGVGLFSLEMSRQQLAIRMLCSEARVNASRVRTGNFLERDWPKLTEAAGVLAEAPIFIDDTPGLDILEVRAKARRLKREKEIGLVVIDYLQLMQGRGSAERREQEISEISRSLKSLAKELDLPIIALSQLNRRVEERPNKRPQLSDLRESGAIEQDADVIIFIYRDELYNDSPENPDKGTAEVIVGKQRNGPTGLTKLRFDGRFTRFDNLDQTHAGLAPEAAA